MPIVDLADTPKVEHLPIGFSTVQPVGAENPTLKMRCADFLSLPEGLDYACRGRTGYNFFSGRGESTDTLPYRELREHAIELATKLVGARLPFGSRLAIVAETTPDFITFFYACQYAGLVPVSLPLSMNIGGHKTYVRRLRSMLASARPIAAMASPELLHLLREATDGLSLRMVGTRDEFYRLPAGGAPRPFGPGDPCYIQYSSGSTTEPRGVLVTQRAITANARAIAQQGLQIRAGDRATSWLPLYHDMGLVGFCITPMLTQMTVDYMAPTTFAVRPRIWLELISRFGGTISFSPTFGYELCVRRSAKGVAGLDLSSWRVAGVGGEMVRPEVLHHFASLFADSGFDGHAFVPSYGLAEATLAVSFTPLGLGLCVDEVNREEYESTGRAIPIAPNITSRKTRAFAMCGRPLPGYAIEIRGDDGAVLPERSIGRVIINGPSLMHGYFEDPERTRSVLSDDGWLDTGDMGYLVDGNLVVTGRRKDLIICNGRNIWPQDLEWTIERLPDVRSGSVAAFSVEDEAAEDERVIIVVECQLGDTSARRRLEEEVRASVHRSAGVNCDVVLVAPRSLPFTSSGKLSRSASRAQYLAGLLKPLAVGTE